MRYSCLNLVDLAGSERLNDYDSRTEAQGETGYINKSLFVLANVINKLAEQKNGYIPYRDSKITRLLSQALGGNSLTTIICTISPASQNYNQTLSTLRFATRAKTVKNKAVLNEYQDEKNVLEEYKREIKKLKDELIVKEQEREKELLQQIIKTNESLTFELENYKGRYMVEREKNDQMRTEMETIKNTLANLQTKNPLTSSQYSVNNTPFNQSQNNSNFISSKENFFPSSNNYNSFQPLNYQQKNNQITENLISSINEERLANFTDLNNVSHNEQTSNNHMISQFNNKISTNFDYQKRPSYDFQTGNTQNKGSFNVNSNQNNNNASFLTEDSYIESVVNKINKNFLLEGNKRILWQDEAQRIQSEYKNDLQNLQNKFSDTIREVSYKYFPKKSIDSIVFNRQALSPPREETRNENIEAEEVVSKIKNRHIFSDSKLTFYPVKNENFEASIKRLRSTYEEMSEKLEKQMDYYKDILESHYRKKIQNAKNFQLNSMDYPNSNLSIMNITTEHNEKLKQLREQYQEKLKSFEQNFFEILKSFTTNLGKSNI